MNGSDPRFAGRKCGYENSHACKCPNRQKHPLLIDGDSVKLGPKVFSPEEIAMLKVKRQGEAQSTYEIFQELDEATLNCALTFGKMDLGGGAIRWGQ